MAEEEEAEVGVGEVCSHCKDWLGEGDEVEDFLCSSWESSRIVVRQPCVVKEEVSNCGVCLFVCIIVWYPLGHKILKLDGATTHQIHDSKSGGHDLRNGGYIILGLIGDFHIMQLIGITKISIISSEDDMCFIGNRYAPSGNGPLDYQLLHDRVELVPICADRDA